MNTKKETVIKIKGMNCTSCSANVGRSLKALNGVLKVNVNFASEKGYITYDENIINISVLYDTIKKLGFEPIKESSDIEQVSLKIGGMHCASCAQNIQKLLNNLKGVKEASLNFSTEILILQYDKSVIPLEGIIKRISNLGYQAGVRNKTNNYEEDNSIKNLNLIRHKMLRAVALSSLIMILMVIRMTGIYVPVYRLITAILAFPVIFIFGFRIHKSSFNSLINKTANMDVLVSLGSLLPYIVGLLGFFFEMQTFIEMAATIVTFHLLGKYLEIKAKGKASDAIKKLIQLGAKTARVLREGKEIELPVNELEKDDILLIKAGEKIPTDGIILEGRTSVDESMVSGESMPVNKQENDEIIGGTINQFGFLKAKVTKIGQETFLSQVIKLVEEAQGSKIPIQDFADRVTGIFVPTILGLTAMTFLSYLIFPEFHRSIILWGANYLPWINPDLSILSLGFLSSIAVLVISCPCALGLGTPTALMVGGGLGAENGILIKNGEAVQTLKEVDAIAFDKTGTITKGKPEVTDIITVGSITKSELLQLSASLESISEHPLARAIIAKAQESHLTLSNVTEAKTIPGKGIMGMLDSHKVIIGNQQLMKDLDIKIKNKKDIDNLEEAAKTVLIVAVDNQINGLIAVADQLKEDSKSAIEQIKKMGIATIMITGDNKKTAEAIANMVNIDEIVSQVLPDGKVDAIKKLQRRYSNVAMVGDGINDAPALKQANIGIAIGTGTDIAIEASDITLVKGDLSTVVASIRLSKQIFRKIKENFFWAWFYNAVAIPIAMLGLLHPMIGAAAMSISSLNVVYNSLKLKKAEI